MDRIAGARLRAVDMERDEDPRARAQGPRYVVRAVFADFAPK